MKSALVTGHRGFVGRNLVPYLENADIYVTGIDLADGEDCRGFFRQSEMQFDYVIHLAAIVGGRRTIDYNPLSVATDLSIDAEMFNWFKRTDQKGKLIYFSSSAAYPVSIQNDGYQIKLSEDFINLEQIENPDMTYGWTKLTGEYLATFLPMEQVVIFRPFSGYGEDQDLDYPFPSFIDRAVRKDDPFVIWGDGYQTRDFIHIKDICEAVIKILELDLYGTYNLGTGIPTNFRQLAKLACEAAGYTPHKFEFRLGEPTGVQYRVADVTKMQNFYIPKISIEEGVERAIYEAKNKI